MQFINVRMWLSIIQNINSYSENGQLRIEKNNIYKNCRQI